MVVKRDRAEMQVVIIRIITTNKNDDNENKNNVNTKNNNHTNNDNNKTKNTNNQRHQPRQQLRLHVPFLSVEIN